MTQKLFTLDRTLRNSGNGVITARFQCGAMVAVKFNGVWELYKETGRNHLEMFQGYASETESTALDGVCQHPEWFKAG